MRSIFPYQLWEGTSLPLVPVKVEKVGTLYAIVDSGANISLFQYEIAELLKIRVNKGDRVPLSGIGGRITGYLHKIILEVSGRVFPCRVCFSKDLAVPLNLLGRSDFFEHFLITFDERGKRTILESRS